MHSWIAASMSPSHSRRREKDTKRHNHHHHTGVREKPHGAESLDPELLCKILHTNISKDNHKEHGRPSSLLSPSYNTLSKSCDDMTKCDDSPQPVETIIHDKKYIGLVPAAYVNRSKSHNDIIIQRRLVTPKDSKSASPTPLPSAYMEERYVIRIRKGPHHSHKMHKSHSGYLKPKTELSRSYSAHNLTGSHSKPKQRHEIITTFGLSPDSPPSSQEISPETSTERQTPTDNQNSSSHVERTPSEEHDEQNNHKNNNNNNNTNNNRESHHGKNSLHHKLFLNLPVPERRHSYVGGQTAYSAKSKSPTARKSESGHSLLSVETIKALVTPHGKKHHRDMK
ncbi:Hypothetical predicted protein [Octopus vulgaris]|uniref:Uncharacterized protein n=2 Tax=Octopus TaxID=6643 RepID=A0AA36BCZ6_OCTVU|nr:M-phase inducer phosphatase-like [Octopus sinensis]CAI9732123.1 Hypothetical predicted protein [Octopus vulgaris]